MTGGRRRWLRGAALGLAAGVVALGAGRLALADSYERRTFDLRVRLSSDARRADAGIVAVVIDQKSLDAVAAPRTAGGLEQGWPWPRDYHAALLRYLLASGARAVVFDLVFSERSIYTQLGVTDDDAALGQATAGHPVVHAVVLTREAGPPADRAWPPALRDAPGVRALAARPFASFDKATPPILPVRRAAAALGWIGFEPDDDGVARTLAPVAAYAPAAAAGAIEVASLPLAAAAVAGARVDVRRDGDVVRGLAVDGRAVPLDERGRMVLRFHGGEQAYRQWSFAAVLRAAMRAEAGQPVAEAGPAAFRGKIVFVGATAAGLLDLRATPMGAVLPGYVLHATALDNLLHGDAIRRIGPRARAAVLVLLATVCGAVASAGGARGGLALAAGAAAVYVVGTLWAFARGGVWLDLLGPLGGAALAWAASTGYGYLTEGRERRFLRDAFSRYLAPDVVSALVAQPGRLTLGGETREVTVMFADVAGFTSLAEGRKPDEVVTLMNECFEALTGAIQAHGGTVDKFIGDAVMAFWNAPVAQPDHAARACRAARDVLAAVAGVNATWAPRGLPPLSMRVGLATGPAVVGNVGSRTKFNYTVMGDTVNLASRLEGAAKQYGAASLVAGTTAGAASGVVLREIDRVRVKGRAEAVPVFSIVADDGSSFAGDDALRAYAKGLDAYRAAAFPEAAAHFDAAAAEGRDGPARVMAERCRALAQDPPPSDWRGEHVLTAK